jgi:hypothetical protein
MAINSALARFSHTVFDRRVLGVDFEGCVVSGIGQAR